MFFETLSTSVLQIFFKLKLYSEVIFKSMTGPDNTHEIDLLAWMCHQTIAMRGIDLSTGVVND